MRGCHSSCWSWHPRSWSASCSGNDAWCARGGAPILDVGLLRRTPGYAGGLAIQTLYFTGFTGIFLVLSVYLQDGLGLAPLAAGLLITPFALGSAVTAPLAGRLVSVVGRRITVISLTVMMTGVLAAALLVPGREPGDLLVGDGADPAAGRARRRWRDLAQLHAEPGGGAAGHGRRGRWGAADRRADRVGHRRGAADDGVPAGRDAPGVALQAALFTALVVLSVAMVMAVRDLRVASGSVLPS